MDIGWDPWLQQGEGGGGGEKKLTFLDNVTQICHVLDGVVREGLLVVFQHIGAQFGPYVGPPSQQEEDKGQETRRGITRGQEHVDDLVPQHDRVFGVLCELLEEDVRLLLARVGRGVVGPHAGLFLASVLESAVDKLLGVGVDRTAGAAVLFVAVGKHQVAQSQAENGPLLGVVQGVVELTSRVGGLLVHQADGLAKHVLTVGVENLGNNGRIISKRNHQEQFAKRGPVRTMRKNNCWRSTV